MAVSYKRGTPVVVKLEEAARDMAPSLRRGSRRRPRPWHEAGPPNHHNDKVDSDQQVFNEELSLCPRGPLLRMDAGASGILLVEIVLTEPRKAEARKGLWFWRSGCRDRPSGWGLRDVKVDVRLPDCLCLSLVLDALAGGWCVCSILRRNQEAGAQGYLAHKKTPLPRTLQ